MSIENLHAYEELSPDQQARKEMGKNINAKDSQDGEKVGNLETQTAENKDDLKKPSETELKRRIEKIRADEAIQKSLEHPTPEEILAQLGQGSSPNTDKPMGGAVNKTTQAPSEVANTEKA